MKTIISRIWILLILSIGASFVLAQTGTASRNDRDLVQRELELRLSREKNDDVRIRIDSADSYFINNNETGVRGYATISYRNGRREEILYDAVIDRRRNSVRLDWSNDNRPYDRQSDRPYGNGRDDYNDGNNRQSSGVLRNGRYEIQLVATRRLLNSNGNIVVQSNSGGTRGGRSQLWDIQDAGNGYYYIRSAETGEAMTVAGDGRSGSSVVLSRLQRNSEDQLWEIRTGSDNGYVFVTRRGKALDSPSSARQDGGRMQVYDRNGDPNQRFLLRQVDSGNYDDRYDDRYDPRRDRQYPDGRSGGSSSGRLTWRARVDDVIELEIRGSSVRERLISGRPTYNARTNFSSPLPNREVNVRAEKRRGRGRVEVLEQPSRRNGYTAIIQIRDSSGGDDEYEIEITWN